uniref:Transcription factor Elf N-terminal domain-containing protein n=1 Tax=Xiphophorus couchianus TaxID=32473 RepID=A0A3B5M447_9TELE
MNSVVVSDGGGNIVEYVTEGVILQEEEGSPAVIVEEVPSAQVEECYSAQVLVYDDGTYLMQDVAEEQEVVTEVAESAASHLHDRS